MANETTSKRGRKAKAEKPAEKVDFKTQLWNAADAMRGNLDAAVYKHVLLRTDAPEIEQRTTI